MKKRCLAIFFVNSDIRPLTPKSVMCQGILYFMFSYLNSGFRSWLNVAKFILYFFSIGALTRTLFVGWMRDSSSERDWWERMILGGILIVIGVIIRLSVIIVGLTMLILSTLLLPILLVIPIRFSYEELVKIGSIGKSWAYGWSPALHKYGTVLYRGPDKKLYGREETVKIITRVLSRDEQNNVLLVGSPGSGRETVVTQFAKYVYRGLVPKKLQNREVIGIHFTNTSINVLQKMFDEATKSGNIILVLHDSEKFAGAFEHMLPLLSAAELEIIAITTYEGYHGVWKQNADIMKYFERVEIPPLNDAETLEFLQDLVYEKYVKIKFEAGVLEEIVKRTNELIQHVPQPEKSIDLLEDLVVNVEKVTVKNVHKVLSQKTGVPIGTLERDEKQILLKLEDELSEEIIGQEDAIKDIASALRRARTGVATREKPIGTFLFLGPTGSGKTHTGKMLAKHYFGGGNNMVRFDMSEFAVESSEPQFIERISIAIEEQPFGLLFFDELEKANKVVWNTLLQVLDEGRLSTWSDRTVSFKNNIIIATSNAGTALIQQSPQITKNEVIQYLIRERIFNPEFLNRFDDIVLFHPLSKKDSKNVMRLILQELNARLMKERGVAVDVTDTLVHALVEIGYSEENGARALRRTVQNKVENVVADMILRDQVSQGTVFNIDRLIN